MSLDFLRRYGAVRMADYEPPPPLLDPPTDDEPAPSRAVLDYEVDPDEWVAFPVTDRAGWRPRDWPARPVRFVDGKDRGRTVAWLRAPGGYPVPVRLGEIGAAAVRTDDDRCRREDAVVERVVAMVVDPFPWDEVEAFAAALPDHGLRLLPAAPPDGGPSHDLEAMRKAADNRTLAEMVMLEETVLAQAADVPTVVDGRLEPRFGGFGRESPIAGVVKGHRENYLHAAGLQVLYDLTPGERTPLFVLADEKLPVVSWFLRLSGANGGMPTWGTVRVEVPRRWFEARSPDERAAHVAALSHLLWAYRSRSAGYARAAVSLHPIVRAEELLGALFSPPDRLTARFYRMVAL